ncbi:MAG: 3-hydroxyacyl-CoA dehydrogenase NAD-binding domain-containing protein [Sediminibacterium sp.]|jgi:3-hydroxybutyryl-CoA dehydrogenase|nr:3-hydroxyacyl-CoA dehydrogenase NAD-binding domain-containing protein [Sediminibacterium sp.]
MKMIAVIGAGTMGNGIAHVFAQHHFLVHLIDTDQSALDKAISTIEKNADRQIAKGTLTITSKETLLSNITTYTDLNTGIGDADLIIEAATENSVVKKKIFAAMDTNAKPNCILASNTSSISISELAAATQRPTQVIGMHFMNPVPVMKLVEVINSKETDPLVTKTIVSLTEQLGKIPCVVNDFPGFIANRILMPMINEAIIALSEGVSDAGTIDQIMKLGMAHPMGPLQLADYIGLDVCKNILEIMEKGLNNSKYAPAGLLVQKVTEGKLGVKTGEGFYKY